MLWTLSVLLIVPGALFPSALRPIQRGWMAFAVALGHFNTRVILTVLFYLVLTPVGFVMRLFRDPLDRSLADRNASQWIKRELQPVEPSRYERQF